MYKYVIVDDRGPITIFTLNRPERLNALGPELRLSYLTPCAGLMLTQVRGWYTNGCR